MFDNFRFFLTDDGSVGLYNFDVEDIYHSRTGAYTEAKQKFLEASGFENFTPVNKTVKLFDICTGIGYNIKTAIESAIKKGLSLEIDSFELDKSVVFLSPFIKDGIVSPVPDFVILKNLLERFPEYSEFLEQNIEFLNKIAQSFLRRDTMPLIRFLISAPDKSFPRILEYAHLHNIYYHNISDSMKNGLKPFDFDNVKINFHIGDARKTLPVVQTCPDFVFHDGFTPSKQPVLWSYDFLNVIRSKMKPCSVFATYSNTLSVRSALKNLGFCLGKTVIDGKQFGTVASLDADKIAHPLDDFDCGLLETKTAINFRDETLSASSDEILLRYNTEYENSDKISAGKYKKLNGYHAEI